MTGQSCLRLLVVLWLALIASSLVLGQNGPFIHDQPSQVYYSEPLLPVLSPPSINSQPLKPPHYDPVNPQLITLRQVTRAAGIIFSGQVLSVDREEKQSEQTFIPNAAPTSITFQVEDGVLGALTGQRLTIHEWAGLWNNGEHYRVGERVFLFLYPPSRLGLTSSVSGRIGRFAIDGGGRIHIGVQHIPVFIADSLLGGRNIVSHADFVKAVRESIVDKSVMDK
jgi:hypothetical protein